MFGRVLRAILRVTTGINQTADAIYNEKAGLLEATGCKLCDGIQGTTLLLLYKINFPIVPFVLSYPLNKIIPLKGKFAF
jgi:hypothetical protein